METRSAVLCPRSPFCGILRISKAGAPGAIRTHSLRIRSPTLYPIELRGQFVYNESRIKVRLRLRGVSGGIRTHNLLGHNQVP
jgi:hypothetical protein